LDKTFFTYTNWKIINKQAYQDLNFFFKSMTVD